MMTSCLYFLRAATWPHSLPSRIYYYLTLGMCLVVGTCYLVMATGFMDSQPYGPNFDFTWVHYVEWTFATPLMLTSLGLLGGMDAASIALMVFYDLLMVGAGFGAQMASTVEGVWPLFAVGGFAQVLVFVQLGACLHRIAHTDDTSSEAKCFSLLFKYEFIVWKRVGGAQTVGCCAPCSVHSRGHSPTPLP
jgi:bacteriorhodopsin